MKSTNLFPFALLLTLALGLWPSALFGQRPTVGLVLSGGGAAGLAHIGVIRVLEEAGIPIDYVGGTSMGSIVGAMYALGYTPDEMEKLVKEMKWDALLIDQIPRNDMTFEYKEELQKYFYSFPVSLQGIQLPSGLVAGSNITNKLAGLTWSACNIRDFKRFPRPFLCVGADIVSGEEVVLTNGILHDALRASMAIPTAFTPVEVHGRLLVDGGFINNFPAEHVKAMGADILIGVDVQRDLYEKSELNSMVNLLKQMSTLTREDINIRNGNLCDLLIRPNTPGASTLTFHLADSIIRHGERTAREQWETIRALGENIRRAGGDALEIKPVRTPIDSVYVREMSFVGLMEISADYLQSRINLPFPAWLTPDDIYRALQRAMGTNRFSKVTYQLDPAPNGVRLVIRAEEKKRDLVHVGFHFDNLFNASLMAKADLRNLWRKGDHFSLNVTLGENPNLTTSYLFLNRKKRNYGLQIELNQMHAYEYRKGKKIGSYTYRDALADFILKTSFMDKYELSAGVQAEFASVAPNITFLDIGAFNSRMVNLYARFVKDDFNRVPYPTQGENVELSLKWVNDFTDRGMLPSFMIDYRHQTAIKVTPKLTFRPKVYAGLSFGDSIPYPYRSYLGGLGYYHKSVIPFVGFNYMERAADFGMVLRADLQYNIKGNHYVIWKNNIGTSSYCLSFTVTGDH